MPKDRIAISECEQQTKPKTGQQQMEKDCEFFLFNDWVDFKS